MKETCESCILALAIPEALCAVLVDLYSLYPVGREEKDLKVFISLTTALDFASRDTICVTGREITLAARSFMGI